MERNRVGVENMKQKSIHSLDEDDDKAVQLFTKLGFSKNLAKTLIYLSQVDECKSADIEIGAKLRQPNVSIAMRELAEQGWITKREIKKGGKGRPTHIYKSKTNLSNVLDILEKEKMKEFENIEINISELKNIIGENKNK
jgi:predicted transcriptional regulator